MIKIRDFKEIPYDALEELNLEAKFEVQGGTADELLCEKYLRYLRDELRLKAVTVCFSDLEGRFHMLDYDKKFLLKSHESLSFDGSSIRGFSGQGHSDLSLRIDWGSFRWLPSDIFGPGKVMVFALVHDEDQQCYDSDFRARLKAYGRELKERYGWSSRIGFEVEGFLFKGLNAEQHYQAERGFDFVSDGGYFHSLPNTPLKLFIDHFAEAKRALGFENEKDHPEVAPSQFELNYRACEGLLACDQVQLYKLLARQIAAMHGLSASFLPKPVMHVNGSGMHTNLSIFEGERNLIFDASKAGQLSDFGWSMVDKILYHANELCLIANSSVNAYRRLDPAFEAPKEIRVSACDRTAMIRVPKFKAKTARFELRSVAPDANPYLLVYSLLRLALGAYPSIAVEHREDGGCLASDIYQAIAAFSASSAMREILGASVQEKFAQLKQSVADRSPRALGKRIKEGEVIFHHEVSNQSLWANF